MKVYRSTAALVAILILATPGAYSFDVNQWGRPKPDDKLASTEIYMDGRGKEYVMYSGNVTIKNKINCIKFLDHEKTGAIITVTKDPPCYEPGFRIISARGKSINFSLQLFYEK